MKYSRLCFFIFLKLRIIGGHMSTKFKWNKKYSVGNDLIDSQHKDLFTLVGNISDSEDVDEISDAVTELYKYTRVHFSTEEAEMQRYEFPQYYQHADLHDNLVSELIKVSSNPISDSGTIKEFQEFLHEWLVDHIMDEDQKFAKFRKNADS